MKKIFTTLLIFIFSLTLVSCSNKNLNENNHQKVYGLSMVIDNITDENITATITYDDSVNDGELFTGTAYDIQKYNKEKDTWESVSNGTLSWNDIAIILNGENHIDYPWTFNCPLQFFDMHNGHYRLEKKINYATSNNSFESKNIYVEFDYYLENKLEEE